MTIVGVIDLLGGRAVHARGGRREGYAPVAAVAGAAIPRGDALSLAREYIHGVGVGALYAADLDAIMARPPQDALVRALAALGVPVWVDAGVTTLERAQDVRRLGVDRVIVGLETLDSFETLNRICLAIGGAHVAFSLDLREGRPLGPVATASPDLPAEAMAARAAEAGAAAVIVLDLDRVGSGAGVDVTLMTRVRAAVPSIDLLAGGGVRDAADLDGLAAAGGNGALVASALLSGALRPREVAGRLQASLAQAIPGSPRMTP